MTLHDPYTIERPPPPVDSSVLELLDTDHFFDQAKGYRSSDATIIGELSAIDAEIDSCKEISKLKDVSCSEEGKVLAELCSIDKLIDKCASSKKGEEIAVAEGDLFDCYQGKRSVDIISPRDVYQSNTSTMMDLLTTDELVDGKREEQLAVDAIARDLHLDLLSVDTEMTTATRQIPALRDAVMDALHALDNEVDASAGRTVATTACTSTISSAERHNLHGVSASAIEAELAAAGLTGVMADLYVTDRRVNGVADASRARDEVAAILELYNIDVTVDSTQAKKKVGRVASIQDMCDTIFMDLLNVDKLVGACKDGQRGGQAGTSGEEGQGADDEEFHFLDPTEGASIRQIQLHAARDLHNEARIGAVMDMLRVDLEIDGKRHHDIDMEGVERLLAVDRSVDGSKAAACREHDISDVLCLLEVDKVVDKYKLPRSAPSGPTDPMEAMLAIDRLVDGTSNQKSQEKVDAIISDLRRNDESVDSLFMPDIFDDMMGAGESTNNEAKEEDIDNLPPPPDLQEDEETDGKRIIFSSKEKKGESSYERQTRDAIRKLHEVDQNVDTKKSKVKSDEPEMHIMLDLFKVDVEVDKAKMAAFQSSKKPTGTTNSPMAEDTDSRTHSRRSSETKRSIFSSKEKESTKTTNIIGTTTVVNNKKRIGSIPLGQVVTSQMHNDFFGEPEMSPIDPYGARTQTSGSKSQDEQCSIM